MVNHGDKGCTVNIKPHKPALVLLHGYGFMTNEQQQQLQQLQQLQLQYQMFIHNYVGSKGSDHSKSNIIRPQFSKPLQTYTPSLRKQQEPGFPAPLSERGVISGSPDPDRIVSRSSQDHLNHYDDSHLYFQKPKDHSVSKKTNFEDLLSEQLSSRKFNLVEIEKKIDKAIQDKILSEDQATLLKATFFLNQKQQGGSQRKKTMSKISPCLGEDDKKKDSFYSSSLYPTESINGHNSSRLIGNETKLSAPNSQNRSGDSETAQNVGGNEYSI